MPDRSEHAGLILHPNRASRQSSRLLYLEPLDQSSSSPERAPAMAEYVRIFRRALPWMGIMFLIGGFAGLVKSARETPVYEAKVSLEIQTPRDSTASLKVGSLDADGITTPESYLPTQIVILQSRTLQQRVRARLSKEKYSSGIPVTGKLALLRRLFGGKVKRLPSNVLPPVTLTVKPTVNTTIVSLLCDSEDPKLAAAYGNALANEYIDANLQAQWDAINHSRQWLAEQLEDTRKKLQASEDQLQAYGEASNLIYTADKENVEQDKLKQLEEALSNAQNHRIETQSAYRIANATAPDAVPQVIDNTRLSEYQAQLADLRRQLADLESQYTPEHPKVKRVQAQIDQLESIFKKERDNVLTRIRNEYQSALMRENLLASAYQQQARVVSSQNSKEINYNILQRDVQTNQQLYDTLLQKAREADIATAMRGSNVRIVDPAVIPGSPIKPNLPWSVFFGSFGGMMLGGLIVFLREQIDRSFKMPGETAEHLNLPELGAIPERDLLLQYGQSKSVFAKIASIPGHTKAVPSAEDLGLSEWRERGSPIAESFRSAVTSVLHSGENGAPRVIVITSAVHGEGKTTVVSNLGMALAEINRRVLLIDGDMRRPRLNELLNLPNDWGLSDLLREKSTLRDCPLEALVRQTEIPELSILTAGPGTNSASSLLLSSQRMLELLQRLRCDFDSILIDTPPMLDISDARVLGRLADAAILVCRAGRTSRDAALIAKKRLADDGIPVLGTILNAWDVKNVGRSYGYGYGYGYSPYEYNDSAN